MSFLKKKLKEIALDKNFYQILTGSIWSLFAQVVAVGLGIASTILIARSYGPEVMGVLAVLNSFFLFTTIFTVLGTNTSILRLLPEHMVKFSPLSARKVYRKILYLVLIVSTIVGLAFFFLGDFVSDNILNKPHLSWYFSLSAIFVVFKSIANLNTQAVRGLGLIKSFSLMHTLAPASNLAALIVLGLFLSTKSIPIYALFFSLTFVGVIGWVIMEVAFSRKVDRNGNYKKVSIKDILSISMPMMMTSSMTFIIGQTGVLMLSIFKTEEEVGYYAIAVKLATLTAFILSAVNSMTAPKFSELYHKENIDALFSVAKKSAKLIFWTTTPILIIFVLFGRNILNMAFGEEFIVSYMAMLLLIAGQFVHSISGATGLFMNMTGHHRSFRNIMIISAMLNVALAYVLIPDYGIEGAAFSAMFCMSLWNIVTLIYIKVIYGRTTGYLPNPIYWLQKDAS